MSYGYWKGIFLVLLLTMLTQHCLARPLYPVAVTTGYHNRSRRKGLLSSSSSKSILQVARKRIPKHDQNIFDDSVLESKERDMLTTKDKYYAELGPVGKIVAGAVEVTVSTALEYVSGFLGGYTLGTVTDIPRLLFRSTNQQQQQTLFQETSNRFIRMHSKSIKWAKTWGGISAAFGGFNVLIKVVRGGKEDDWNSIISSTAAGVFFARKEGPQGMLRAAVLYGGMMYVIHGGMMTKRDPSRYVEEPIDF